MSQAELSRKALALKPEASAAEVPGVRTILRMPQVEAATGLKQSHIYDLIAQGRFPRGVKLSPMATGWFADEIARWQSERPRAMGGWCPSRRAPKPEGEAA